MGSQAQQVLEIPAAFVGHKRQGAVFSQSRKTLKILLWIKACSNRLLQQNNLSSHER